MNKNVPKLRIKGFGGKWERYKASDLFINISDKNHNGDLNVLSVTQDRGVMLRSELDIDIKFDPNSLKTYKKVSDGDFIISLRSFQGGIETSNQIGLISPAYTVFNFKEKEKFDTKFMGYILKSEKFIRKMAGLIYGIRDGKAISFKDFSTMYFKLPSLQEQEKIANFLTKVDIIIEKQDKKVEYWNSYKKGMMQKIFSQKIRFKDKNGCDYLEWGEKFIGDICDVGTGKKDTKDKIDNGEYPFFVRSQTIEGINSYSFDGEAILTAGDGVGVGKVFHYVDCKFDYHQRVYKLSDFKNINGRYLYEYFSKNFKREVAKYNAKTSVDSVRLEMITKMKIPYPCLEEQTKIANFLSNIDNIIEKENKKLEELKQWKKGLLQQMFV